MFTDLVAAVHVIGAVAALVLGLAVLTVRKGDQRHRRMGYGYAVLLVALNLAALALHREDVFGPFHILAVLSLATVIVGIGLPILRPGVVAAAAVHGYLMAWSYVGVVAAAVGQLAVQAEQANLVLWAILITLLIGGLLITRLMPGTLRRTFPALGTASGRSVEPG
ncbi:MAG: DUF2306 domain-containing protein [Actinomycetia bacterium]|nr:DUF2306 domain-containing protein [Actinomycetes bacterium]